MKKVKIYLSILSLILFSLKSYAICPICTVAVAAGVGLSRYLGIDDTISGVWIGGLTVSLILWNVDWFNRKKIKFIGRNFLTAIFWYLLIVVPLYFMDVLGHPLNRLWGVDKLFLGIGVGSIVFLFGAVTYFYMKKRHGGHAYFPFQKVAQPVGLLVLLSLIFYFITR